MTRRLYARDIRGAESADLEGSARSGAVAIATQSPMTARHQPHVALMLGLQRTAGNQAVLGLLGLRPPRHSLAPAHAVQRQDDDYEDAGSSWSGGEESTSSDYSSGESSGAGSEWSSGGADGGAGGGGGEGGESGGTSEAPTAESPGGGSEWSGGGGAGGEEATGSEWSGGGGGGEGGGGEGGSAGGGESAGSEWSGGGESAGSGWSGGGGGEEASGDDGGGSSWWPFGGGDEESGEDESGDEGEFSPEQIQEKLDEGEIAPVEDAAPSIRSSPIYTPPPGQGPAPSGFHDGGRSGTVPFGSVVVDGQGDDDPNVPHAITIGGRAGSIAWSGGGKAGGPKGHPGTGLPSVKVEPKYDTAWNGPVAFASAWVIPGTGVFDVHRTYVTSNAGDQGNGWWISARAAAALEAHEVRHLESAKTVYGSRIQPLLDRIAKSKSVGYHTNYLASHAIVQLENYIKWKTSIEKFVEEDAQWNADGGQIDTEDYVSAGYPHNQQGPKTIEGKTYDKYLVMNDEEPPP